MDKTKYFVLLLLPLFVMTAMPASAQSKSEFRVAGFEESPFDLSAREKPTSRDDGTGSLYAIVKVTSTNPDDDLSAYNFDFGYLQHVVESKDDELWLYVQQGAKAVTITRNGYNPVRRYSLSTTIQPGKVYTMLLSVEAPNVFRQMLEFNVQPASAKATIMINSQKQGAQMENFGTTSELGSVARNIELGVYTYTVVADKYHNSEGRIVLDKRNGHHVEKVTLRPNFSHITFKAAPGADIYINDEKIGRETWSGDLKAGVYSVECRKPKHKSVVELIKIVENNDRVIELREPVPQTGVIAVTSEPLGARIKVDGKDYGVTPKNIVDLLIGSHKVEISKKNYKSVTTTVEVREDETTECNAKLNKVARVTINSTPREAQLYINGKKIGTTPQTMEFESGNYVFRLTKEHYHDFEKRVHVDISKPELKFSLKRQYQKKFSGYFEAAGQFGSLMGVGANAGCYISNFNIEAYGTYSLGKETVFVNYTNGTLPGEEKPSAIAFGGKVGYGFVLGTRFRLTPQVGAGAVSITSDNISSSVITASVGLRCECALFGHLGVSITPEYTFAVSKKDVFKQLEAVSSGIKGWGSGFNARVGLYLYF